MLKKRDVIRMIDGEEFKVLYVNSCRAHCQATCGKVVAVRGRTFTRPGRTIDISPEAFVEVVRRDRRVKGWA